MELPGCLQAVLLRQPPSTFPAQRISAPSLHRQLPGSSIDQSGCEHGKKKDKPWIFSNSSFRISKATLWEYRSAVKV
jgi:hypothetical protein